MKANLKRHDTFASEIYHTVHFCESIKVTVNKRVFSLSFTKQRNDTPTLFLCLEQCPFLISIRDGDRVKQPKKRAKISLIQTREVPSQSDR